ncbi:hypothetical protein [Sphingobium lactosutens]|uniref:hypothetical protein n=1 Tax=Sphingobium lactosutens TaxID=522773 RepID=UPI0015B9B213|nr:hypothetical protein [Sphingobium lactosutens]
MQKVGKFALIMLTLATACSGPTRDPSVLQAIRTEARMLSRSTARSQVALPKSKWPQAISGLEPENVTISADGVDILVKPYFDGGWGYFIPPNDRELPEPKGRFEPVGKGVYWYCPY